MPVALMLVNRILDGATMPAVTKMFREMLPVMEMHTFLLSLRSCFDSLICCVGDIPSQVVLSPASAEEYLTVLYGLHKVYFRRVFLVAKVLIYKVHCLASSFGYLTNRSTHLDVHGNKLLSYKQPPLFYCLY